MKRRCQQSSISPPSRIPTSSHPDNRRGKRVRFTDDDVDHSDSRSFRIDVSSSIPVGAVKPTRRSDAAKTAEFAFFKKLKEDAGAKFPSHPEYTERNDQSDKCSARNACNGSVRKSASLISEPRNAVKNGNKEFQPSSLLENATPSEFVSFKSPLGSACTPKNSDARRKEACTDFSDVLQRPQDVEDYSHPFRSQGQGILDGNGDIFSIKRQKLNQWVRDISFPESDGLKLKGGDIVHNLLRRLIPENKDKNKLKDQKVGQVETDVYPDSDLQCKKLQKTNGIGLIEPGFGSYHGDDIMYHQSDKLRGNILYLDAPYSHENTRNHWPRVWESDSKFDRKKHPLCLNSAEPVEELGVISQANRYFLESSLNTDMMGLEFGTNNAKMNFAMDIQDIEPMDCPTSPVPWIPNREYDGRGLFSLPRVHINEGTSLIPWVNDRKFDAHNLFPLSNHHINDELERTKRAQWVSDDKFDARNLFPTPKNQINEGTLIPWVNDREFDARNLFPLPSNHINEEDERTSLIPWVNDRKFDGQNLFPVPNHHIIDEPERTTLTQWVSDDKYDARNLFPSPKNHINEGALIPWVNDRKSDSHNWFPLPSNHINEEDERTSLIPWANDSNFEARNLFLLPSNHIDEESEDPLPLSLISSHRSHRYEHGIPVIEAEHNTLSDRNNIPLPKSCRNIHFSAVKDSYSATGFLNQEPQLVRKIFRQTKYIVPIEHVLGLDVSCFPIRSPRDLYTSSRRSPEYPTEESVIYHYDEYELH